jgi:DNA-binding MarR family transcriptional regulator
VIDKKFRKLMMDHPDIVRKSVLTEKQVELARIVHQMPTPIYSRDIADRLYISVQNASVQLSRLVQAGYATRHEVVSKTGGMEFQYLPTLT